MLGPAANRLAGRILCSSSLPWKTVTPRCMKVLDHSPIPRGILLCPHLTISEVFTMVPATEPHFQCPNILTHFEQNYSNLLLRNLIVAGVMDSPFDSHVLRHFINGETPAACPAHAWASAVSCPALFKSYMILIVQWISLYRKKEISLSKTLWM